VRRRGLLPNLVYALQGVGGLFSTVTTAIVIAAYHNQARAINDVRNLSTPCIARSVSGAWRILQGRSLVPAFGLLYFCLAVPESTRFVEARKLQNDPDLVPQPHSEMSTEVADDAEDEEDKEDEEDDEDECGGVEDEAGKSGRNGRFWKTGVGFAIAGERPHYMEPITYFKDWRHMKGPIKTSVSWLLQAVSYYRATLAMLDVLMAVKITSKKPYDGILKYALGNLITNVAGYLPGSALVEAIGRISIQARSWCSS
jgi:MFS transporter, PHS family, inorganic phosphate transporter